MFERPYNYMPSYHGNPYIFHQNTQQQNHASQMYQNYNKNFQTPFEIYSKPKQPMGWPPYAQSIGGSFNAPPKNNLLYYFQDNNGEMDLDKMLSTAGQIANTFQQVSPVVKQVGSMMKQFR
ncbi:YppG-like protein [Virgibacillus subterraneus]|uniref:YppG-like protein n=1 Tax=Virgibacillus subterraneus TaxID=621109 RepID=A0A1H9ISA6_9BACI|nr:YppG family protein [Virgibacillus subterraneus]SEQ77454.1 YppG-like protein [Virgibacillus subterraneus]